MRRRLPRALPSHLICSVSAADGTGVVVDVRPDALIDDQAAEAFAVTARACNDVGWMFRRAGGPSPVLAANVRWLAGYRHPRCLRPAVGDALMALLGESRMRGSTAAHSPGALQPT